MPYIDNEMLTCKHKYTLLICIYRGINNHLNHLHLALRWCTMYGCLGLCETKIDYFHKSTLVQG